MPSDVQRWPAVPKPANSAPSTARSRSASSITTIGFLPPSSRHGDCRWRPQSAPISAPTADEPVKPTLSTSRSSSARSSPRERRRAVGLDEVQHALRHAAGVQELRHRAADRRAVLGRLPDDRVAAQDRRHEVPRRHRAGEVAGGDDRRDADRRAEREQLLVGHLGRDRLAVQPAALAEEEVARVDDLLDLAERLRVRLADLARDQARERLLVGLDQPPDLRDHAPADRRRHRGPRGLRGARRAARVDEAVGVREQHLGDDVGAVGRVGRLQPPAGRVAALLAVDDRCCGAEGGGGVGHDRHLRTSQARAAARRSLSTSIARTDTGSTPRSTAM